MTRFARFRAPLEIQSSDKTTGVTTSHLTEETTSHSTKRDKTCAKWLVITQQKTLGKSLVIAIPLGHQKTVTKWLVINKTRRERRGKQAIREADARKNLSAPYLFDI